MEFANPEEYQSKIKQILITEDQIKEALKKQANASTPLMTERPFCWSAFSRALICSWQI